jgi:transcriptional regulator with XRE-family HTH domain
MEPMAAEKKLSIGEILKQGRARQRLTIEECAKRTHIATRYLTSLEENHWEDLPSESHRLGFLRNYCRFLGVPAEEVLALYRQAASQAPAPAAPVRPKPQAPDSDLGAGWSAPSSSQLIGLGIVVLILAWLIYHGLSRPGGEAGPGLWVRRRESAQARLAVPKPSITVQRIRVKAQGDSWLRIVTGRQLLFEGILPAGAAKEWSANGPFQIKLGNVRALSLFWNDQPVDIQTGARAGMNEIQIPPK